MNWLGKRTIAHRGLHLDPEISENSLLAFMAAIEHGYAVELDVRLSADGRPIVFHDKNLFRLTGKRGLVERKNYHELEKLFLLGTNQKIPLLKDVLSLINGKTPILIDIKRGEGKSTIASLLSFYKGDFAIQASDEETIRWFQKNKPDFILGRTVNILKLFKAKFNMRSLEEGVDFITYNYKFQFLLGERENKLPLVAWTVNSHREMDKALALADNVIFEGFLPPTEIHH